MAELATGVLGYFWWERKGVEGSVDRDTGLNGGWGLVVPAFPSWTLCVTEISALCHVRGSR